MLALIFMDPIYEEVSFYSLREIYLSLQPATAP